MQKVPYCKAEIQSYLIVQILMIYYLRTGDPVLVKKGIRKVKKVCNGYPDLLIEIRAMVLETMPEFKQCFRDIDISRG